MLEGPAAGDTAAMGVTLEHHWWTEANGVHRACYLYAQRTRATDPLELCRFVMARVPGGQAESMEELIDGRWVPVLDVSFGNGRYRIEHLVAQYRAGQELVVVEP